MATDTDTDYTETLHHRIEALRIEVAELQGALAKRLTNGILLRGAAYNAALKDADYKKCEKCGEPCSPMCPGCEVSEWERTAHVYYEAKEEAEEWRRGAEGALIIALPPRTGEHTEEAYSTHKARYVESANVNGAYALGADAVAATLQKLKDKAAMDRVLAITAGSGALSPIDPDAIREIALGRLGLNQTEHDLLMRVADLLEAPLLGCQGDGHYLCRECGLFDERSEK